MNYAGNISITQAFWGNKTLTPYNAFVGVYPLLGRADDRLYFEAIEYSTFVLSRLASVSTVEYSIDGGTTWDDVGTTQPVALQAGDIAYIRGKILGDLSQQDYTQFEMTGKIAVKGNIMYLRNYENPSSLEIPYERCFYKLFFNCTSLIQAHELKLPATTLATSCYYGMFANCYGLTTAPSLPATSLVRNCYGEMFRDCASLTTAPSLPATSLAYGCYIWMFSDCTNLTTAPSLPATILADYCYAEMFSGCSNLTTAPELPATTLSEGCYDNMFNDCIRLTTAPSLPATILTRDCYRNMFRDCVNLTSIECLATDIYAELCTLDWVNNVASSGTFYRNSTNTSWTRGNDGIPTGWSLVPPMPMPIDHLRFEAVENSTFGLNKLAFRNSSVEYSIDNGSTWNNLTASTTVSLNAGDIAYLRGKITGNLDSASNGYTQFKMTGKIACKGNIMYLYNYETLPTTITYECAFFCLFYNCTSLTSAPIMPATSLASSCYSSMFDNCTSLTTAPELPATTLADSCYSSMFCNCTSLTTAPELPATTLAPYCYRYMFVNCTSLTTAPELPATSVSYHGYEEMFDSCSSLNYIKCLATNISARDCTSYWVYGVASSGTFVKASTMTAWTTDESGIPEGWTVINELP